MVVHKVTNIRHVDALVPLQPDMLASEVTSINSSIDEENSLACVGRVRCQILRSVGCARGPAPNTILAGEVLFVRIVVKF